MSKMARQEDVKVSNYVSIFIGLNNEHPLSLVLANDSN